MRRGAILFGRQLSTNRSIPSPVIKYYVILWDFDVVLDGRRMAGAWRSVATIADEGAKMRHDTVQNSHTGVGRFQGELDNPGRCGNRASGT